MSPIPRTSSGEHADAARRRTMIASPYVLSGEDIEADVVRRVASRVLRRSEQPQGQRLDDIAHQTIHAEQSRLAHEQPHLRARADRQFISWLRRELARADEARRGELVCAIIARYAREIAGHFDIRAYRIATRVVPAALSVLFHGLSPFKPKAFDVDGRIRVEGEPDTLRALARIGTVILAPTRCRR